MQNHCFFKYILIVASLCVGLLLPARIGAQKPGDSLEMGLKVLSFEIIEDNFTGFEDGNEKKLRNAIRNLNDRFSAAARAQFKAYNLGLYRISNDEGNTQEKINTYITEAAGGSQYYIIAVEIWKRQQELDDLLIYYKLPEAEIPAFLYFESDDIRKKAISLIEAAYSSRNKNPGRVKESEAEGILKWNDFLFAPVEVELLSTTPEDSIPVPFTFPGEIAAKSNSQCPGGGTFVTVAGELIALPPGAIPYYIQCGTPKGAMYQFKLNNILYETWITRTKPSYFVNFAPQISAGVPGPPYIPTCDPDEENVHYLYSQGDSLRGYLGRMPGAPVYTGVGKAKPEKPSIIDLVVGPVLLPGSVKASSCKAYLPYNSVDNKKLPKGDSGGEKDTEAYQEADAPEVLDYTGRFSNLKALIVNAAYDEAFDIIITDNSTSNTILKQISELKPVNRAVLWVRLDYASDKFYSQIFLPSSIETKAGSDFGKMKSLFWSITKDLAELTVSETTFLNYLSLNRYIFGVMAQAFNDAKIPEKYWNTEHPDYFLNGTILSIVNKTVLPETIAVVCGMEHSLLDNLATLAGLAGLPATIVSLVFDAEFRNSFKEKTGAVLNALQDAQTREFIWSFVVGKFSSEWNDVFTNGNTSKAFYYLGYIAMEITIGVLTAGTVTAVKSAMASTAVFKTAVELIRIVTNPVKPIVQSVALFVKKGYTITKNGTKWVISGIGRDMDALGRILISTIDEFLPPPSPIPNGYMLAAVTPDGKIYTLLMKSSGDGFFRLDDLLTLLKQALGNSAVTSSRLQRIADEISDAVQLTNPNLAAAIRQLDNNSTSDFTKRIAFFDDLLNSYNSPNGLGANLRNLTPEMIEAWDIFNSAKRDISLRTSFKNLSDVATILKEPKLLNLGFNKSELTAITTAIDNYSKHNSVTKNIATQLDKEVFENIKNFGEWLKSNPNTQIVSGQSYIISNLKNSGIGNQIKGTNFVLKNLVQDGNSIKNKQIRFEFEATNQSDNTSRFDLIVGDASEAKAIEFKSGTGSITKQYFYREFFERDLTIAETLDEIEWRVEQFPRMDLKSLVKKWMLDYGDLHYNESNPAFSALNDFSVKYCIEKNITADCLIVDGLDLKLRINGTQGWFDAFFDKVFKTY